MVASAAPALLLLAAVSGFQVNLHAGLRPRVPVARMVSLREELLADMAAYETTIRKAAMPKVAQPVQKVPGLADEPCSSSNVLPVVPAGTLSRGSTGSGVLSAVAAAAAAWERGARRRPSQLPRR